MKKIALILLFAGLATHAFSQVGDLSVGLKSGYATNYDNFLYGFDVAYNLTGALEVAFTGLMNPEISQTDDWYTPPRTEKLSVYSANLDARLYIISSRTFGIGPALGGQYFAVKNKTKEAGTFNTLGFNIGVHGKVHITDNLLVNGGWRYTNAKEKTAKHSLFYLGVAYVFQTR